MSENVVKLVDTSGLQLSNAERERLLKVARLREKVAKAATAERSAQLMADFEQGLGTDAAA